jgi:hypothetical protein
MASRRLRQPARYSVPKSDGAWRDGVVPRKFIDQMKIALAPACPIGPEGQP